MTRHVLEGMGGVILDYGFSSHDEACEAAFELANSRKIAVRIREVLDESTVYPKGATIEADGSWFIPSSEAP